MDRCSSPGTFFLVFSAWISCCAAFYLPGVAPVSYCEKGKESKACWTKVELFVNRLNSVKTVIPFEYSRFDFCVPTSDEKTPTENLGQVVFGERIRPSMYNDDAQEEFGWKLVHGDVFRPPKKGMLLSVMLGCGSQIFFYGISYTSVCLSWVFVSRKSWSLDDLFVVIGGEFRKTNVLLSAFFFPGLVFGIFFLLNLVLWAEGSSAAVPSTTLQDLLALWFGISVPLTFLGAYLGFKKKPIEQPVRTNQIPRQIPEQSIFTRAAPGIIMGGVLPFGCIFIQLFFILNSIWSHQIYYMFGFLFVVCLFLLLTVSETTVLLCYVHLRAGDYHWWWRSFLTGGCTALYFFLYSIHFFCTKLTISGTASTFLYFGYTLIMVLIFFLFTGTVGFFACFFFVRKIYSVVPIGS